MFVLFFRIELADTMSYLVPEQIQLKDVPPNPSLPPRKTQIPSPLTQPATEYVTTTHGTGPERIYLDIQSQFPSVAYPPRPIPGSIADLDIVMEHCEFSKNKVHGTCILHCCASHETV